MNITIRNETINDYRKVEEVTREAFWNHHVPGCDEHYLVHRMRSHQDFIKELDYVALIDGKIVGNIMYTRAWLVDEDNNEKEITCFGPVSVLPEYQRKGIGSALIEHTIKILKLRETPGIVIFGDPHNYCKHGFKSSKDYCISDANGEFPYGMLANELVKDAFSGHTWKYKYSDVYHIDAEKAQEYDKNFPSKEKGYKYTQEIFSIAFRSYVR
jgi:putative acetyltransferase